MAQVRDVPGLEVVEAFVRELAERTGAIPIESILFGSRARGDATDESDYDVLLVYDEVTPELRAAVEALEGEYALEHLAAVSAHLISWPEMRQKSHQPFVINARREGIFVGEGSGPRAVVPVIMEKARKELDHAERLLESAEWGWAAGRAYYAVFHALTALHASRGETFSKHSGVISEFNRQHVKTGVFSAHFSAAIERLRKWREVGEYDYVNEVSEPDAREGVAAAREIVGAVAEYIGRQG